MARRVLAVVITILILASIAYVGLPFSAGGNPCGPAVASAWEREPEGRVVTGHLLRPPTVCARAARARLRASATGTLLGIFGLAGFGVRQPKRRAARVVARPPVRFDLNRRVDLPGHSSAMLRVADYVQ